MGTFQNMRYAMFAVHCALFMLLIASVTSTRSDDQWQEAKVSRTEETSFVDTFLGAEEESTEDYVLPPLGSTHPKKSEALSKKDTAKQSKNRPAKLHSNSKLTQMDSIVVRKHGMLEDFAHWVAEKLDQSPVQNPRFIRSEKEADHGGQAGAADKCSDAPEGTTALLLQIFLGGIGAGFGYMGRWDWFATELSLTFAPCLLVCCVLCCVFGLFASKDGNGPF